MRESVVSKHGLYDCWDGYCGRYDCVTCDPSLLCSECELWMEVCSCPSEQDLWLAAGERHSKGVAS